MDDFDTSALAQQIPAEFPAALREAAVTLRLAAGARLFSIGERPQRMFYVTHGEVRLTRASAAGAEAILQRSGRGFIAEASLDASAYHCDAAAAVPSVVLAFPIPLFRRLLDGDAGFRADWRRRLAQEVRRLRARCERLSLKSAQARIFHYLETEVRAGEGAHISSRKAWAAELGLSHEALYRTLARLEKDGLIFAVGKVIGIRSPEHSTR